MRKYKWMVIIISFVVLGWKISVPGEINPCFSIPPGFYSEAVSVAINYRGGVVGRNYDIYYTLDGSTPTNKSLRYEKPIYIGDRSEEENVYSARSDISEYKYYKDVSPGYKVDKATILKAVVYDGDNVCSKVISATYFIHCGESPKYDNITVISLTTEPEKLFGYENGIYVKGITESMYLKSIDADAIAPNEYPANYNLHGKEWEIPVCVEIFSEDKENYFVQNVGMRIKGSWGRSYAQKSLKLYARGEYDGNQIIKYDFFEKGVYADRVVLSACGDDKRTKLKDALVNSLTKNLEIFSVDYKPCLVFLDGEYWGVYQITYEVNGNYLEKNYNVSKENVIRIKNGELAEGREKDYQSYENFLDYIKTQDIENDLVYKKLENMVDIKNLIEYYCVNIYINNTDWPQNNVELWRSRKHGKGQYEDTKWRFVLYDVNDKECMSPENIESDTLKSVLEKDEILKACMKNKKFREEFYRTFLKIGYDCFERDKAKEMLYLLAMQVEIPMQEDYIRFENRRTKDYSFEKGIQDIETFLNERDKYIKRTVYRNNMYYEK